MSYLPQSISKTFGSTDNLGKDLNDEIVIDLTGESFGFSSIGFYASPPTGGEITFEGTFDDIHWEAFSIRSTTTDDFFNKTDNAGNFIGSIAALRKFRVRTSIAGSGNGTFEGRYTRHVSILEGIEFGNPPHRFGFVPIHRDGNYTNAQTATALWTPTSGKKYVVTDFSLIISGSTDGIITIFDETNEAGKILFKGSINVSNNYQFAQVMNFVTPFIAGAIDNVLKITTSSNMTVDILVHGYEV